jgi:hypothetical protein
VDFLGEFQTAIADCVSKRVIPGEQDALPIQK